MLGIGLGMGVIAGVTPWSPLSLAPIAWFRGDVGSGASWTDQSGNGNNAPAGGTAPTLTTLGGKPAFSLSGGGSFVSTATNLVTAGSIYTTLSVAQAVDTTGGTLFAIRSSSPGSDSLFLTLSGITYVWSDGVAYEANIVDTHVEVQSPFLSEHAYGGSGTLPSLRLNRSNRTVGGSTQTSESGTTGFVIGDNVSGQPWNGKIAELVVLNRALTSDERTAWEAYVSGRYGI